VSPTGQGDVTLLAKSILIQLLTQLQNPQAQIITSFSDVSVTQNQTEKRQLDLTASIFLTSETLWEFAILGFSI
jgi:hypothetical protein